MENSLKELYVSFRVGAKPCWPLARMQRLSKTYVHLTTDRLFKRGYIMTNIENEKIISPLKLMTKSEVVNDLLKLLDMVQKHANKEGCQHCLDLLESVFEH